jgi:hypothetical protein
MLGRRRPPSECTLSLDKVIVIRPALCTERIPRLAPARMGEVCDAVATRRRPAADGPDGALIDAERVTIGIGGRNASRSPHGRSPSV